MTPGPAAAAIAAADTVRDVLARDESLVEVFVRHSPHFEKLRQRALRRVMARLVTVRQAARIAGVDVEVLLRDLNAALGIAAAEAPAGAPSGVPEAVASLRRPSGAPEVELDVRDVLRAGGEPFSRIMAAVAALPGGAVLRLRVLFEPAPLYAVLGKRGFVHETHAVAPDDWMVWFWRQGVSTAEADSRQNPEDGLRTAVQTLAADLSGTPEAAAERTATSDPGADANVWLDVRVLEPPEPLLRTLAALERLQAGHTLVQINVRVPQFLLPVLAERGFACDIDESQADRVLVRIWRP